VESEDNLKELLNCLKNIINFGGDYYENKNYESDYD